MTARIAVIGLVVADMKRSLDFYRLLGIDLATELDSEPHVQAPLPGGLQLAWDTEETIRSFDPTFAPTTGSGMSLAFECDDAADVDVQYAAVMSAGHESHLEPFDAFWGQRYASVVDPDGNGVDLFAASA